MLALVGAVVLDQRTGQEGRHHHHQPLRFPHPLWWSDPWCSTGSRCVYLGLYISVFLLVLISLVTMNSVESRRQQPLFLVAFSTLRSYGAWGLRSSLVAQAHSKQLETTMELLQNLITGFLGGVYAGKPQLCLGCLLGTLVGVLPRVGASTNSRSAEQPSIRAREISQVLDAANYISTPSVFTPIPDTTVRLNSLRAGDPGHHRAWRQATQGREGRRQPARNAVVAWASQSISESTWATARADQPTGQDKRVRQALDLAIDLILAEPR